MEKESFILFVDNSGSVGGSKNYWETIQFIISKYAKDISHYYLWNSQCYPSSLNKIQSNIASKQGLGGTTPSNVAATIVKNRFDRIILVTDGEVSDNQVKECDKIFQTALKNDKFKLAESICYIISSGNSQVDMSVTCPFTRYCPNKVFTKKNGEVLKAIVEYTAEDYNILLTLDQITLKKFEAKYELIEGLIIAQNIGKEGNIPLKNQLVSLKQRLVDELSKIMATQTDYGLQIRKALQNKDFNTAIEVADLMCNNYFSQDFTIELQKKISHLINLCGDLRGKYNLGQIKSNKIATAQNSVEGQLDKSIEIDDLSKFPIECPIIMDEDVPQILIDQCQPFLLGIQKNIVDDISACPLRILNYPELKAKFKSRISTFTGVKYADKMLKNPFTQNRLIGAIPLGNHKSHVVVGNHTIAKLITGGKIMGNLNMYYAVIWYLINEGEVQYLNPISNNATQHLIYRLKNSKTMASMCGLSQFVTTQIPTDVAVWYCVNSGYLNQPTNRDAFRFHLPNLEPMVRIVKTLGYPIHKGLKPHFIRTKTLVILLSKFKKLSTLEKKQFKVWCKGFYQRGLFIDCTKVSQKFKQMQICPSFIPIDGEPEANQANIIKQKFPIYSQQLSTEELYYISTLLDAQKSASDIFLDYNLKVPPLPKPEINWCYGLQEQFNTKLKFNPKTLRPFYYVQDKMWQDLAKECYKVSDISELFSGCRYMVQYIFKYQKHPESNELLLYYYNRVVQTGKKDTLPYMTIPWTNQIIDQFVKVCGKYEIKKVIAILSQSRSRASRMMMETGKCCEKFMEYLNTHFKMFNIQKIKN